MEYLMIVVVTCLTLGSQLLLKKAILDINPLMQSSKIDFFVAAIASPYVLSAIAMQGFGFFLWIFVLSRMKLGTAYAISGAFFYILIAIFSLYLYGEKLSILQWAGLLLITAGVVLMGLSKV